MKKVNVTIQITSGLEARPVAFLVQLASRFDSSIYLVRSDKKVNAKSIMGMMAIGLVPGESLEVQAEGADEEAAAQAVAGYLSGEVKE